MDFFTSIPTHIDYVGQAKAEKLYRAIITLFSIVGFVWGYIVQQFSQSVYILGAGFILAAILTVPPWPMYRRNPLNWQNPRSNEEKPAGKKGKKWTFQPYYIPHTPWPWVQFHQLCISLLSNKIVNKFSWFYCDRYRKIPLCIWFKKKVVVACISIVKVLLLPPIYAIVPSK